MFSGCVLNFGNTSVRLLRESSGGLKADKMWLKTNLVYIPGFHELFLSSRNFKSGRYGENSNFNDRFSIGKIN